MLQIAGSGRVGRIALINGAQLCGVESFLVMKAGFQVAPSFEVDHKGMPWVDL